MQMNLSTCDMCGYATFDYHKIALWSRLTDSCGQVYSLCTECLAHLETRRDTYVARPEIMEPSQLKVV